MIDGEKTFTYQELLSFQLTLWLNLWVRDRISYKTCCWPLYLQCFTDHWSLEGFFDLSLILYLSSHDLMFLNQSWDQLCLLSLKIGAIH